MSKLTYKSSQEELKARYDKHILRLKAEYGAMDDADLYLAWAKPISEDLSIAGNQLRKSIIESILKTRHIPLGD